MDKKFYIYEVEARKPDNEGMWLTIRVIATDGELALAAAKPLAAEYYGIHEFEVSLRLGSPSYKVDALVGLIER